MVHYQGDEIRATVSIGLAAMEEDELESRAALPTADAALYRAKSMGGNMICFGPLTGGS